MRIYTGFLLLVLLITTNINIGVDGRDGQEMEIWDRVVKGSSRSLGGTIIKKHSMPWLVFMIIPGNRCTGSILGRRHVLTAAHCDGATHVAVGAHDIKKIGNCRRCAGKKIEILKFQSMSNVDLAVVTLKEDIDFKNNPKTMKRAKLAVGSENECAQCTGSCSGVLDVAGWGRDPVDPTTFHLPKKITKKCVKCPRKSTKHMCAMSNIDPYEHDVCGGDSGGPLTKEGTNVVVGIVESGKPCDSDGKRVGKYVDVRKSKVQAFIRNIVPDVDIEGGHYKLGEWGTMNCPEGNYHLVTDKDECRINAAAFFTKPFNGAGCYDTEFAGCHDNGPFIYFSTCAKPTTRWNHAAVCSLGA